MKRLSFIVLLGLISSLSYAQFKTPGIQVKKKDLVIGGVKVTPDWYLAPALEILGPADRVRSGFNKTHTYDQYGIVLFESTSNNIPSGKLTEFQVHFIMDKNEVNPNGTYPETVRIDKARFDRNSSREMVLKKLAKWRMTESYIEHSIRLDNGALYAYFQFTDDENSLKKISIGKNTK